MNLSHHRSLRCVSRALCVGSTQVGVNKDSYLILDTLPAEYDARVKAMEVDEKPTEDYSDIGGLDKQIQELVRCPCARRTGSSPSLGSSSYDFVGGAV
jgi:ATP-dependent 26S proteasome regulatory subunit